MSVYTTCMKLIVIYGPPASGKYTVAKKVAQLTGFKLLHNHLSHDLVKSIFEFGTPTFVKLNKKLRLELIDAAAQANIDGLIITLVYAKGEDDRFVHNMIDVVTRNKGDICFVQVYAATSALLDRVKNVSRKEFKKVMSEDGLARMLRNYELFSEISFVDSLRLDTTNLSPEETVKKIIEYCELEARKEP